MAFNACGPSATTFSLCDDFLTVSDGRHGPSITIQLDGDSGAGNIVLGKDANGDTEVTFNSPSAITGTQTTCRFIQRHTRQSSWQ